MFRHLRPLSWLLTLLLPLALACGSSGDESTPDAPKDTAIEAEDTSADQHATEAEDASADQHATEAEVTPEVSADVDEWVPELGPQCVEGFCAAGPDVAPDPRQFGPFPVGVRTITYVDPERTNPDGSPRTLVTDIWYPAVESARGGQKEVLDLVALAPDWAKPAFGDAVLENFDLDCYRDVAPRADQGPFPLVLFSHGAYGIRFQSVFFTIQLASHGYVVVSPDHEKNTLWEILVYGYDQTTLFPSAERRPYDLLFLIDTMEAKARDAADDFHHLIDTTRVGVTGHSFGGFAAFGPAEWDSRVKAIVPMAPAAKMVEPYLKKLMKDWKFPTLMMGGDLDNTLPFDLFMLNPYLDMQPPKWFLRLPRGGHYTFTDMCRLDLEYVIEHMDFPDAEDALRDGCNPVDNVSWELAHRAINLYAIAFLNYYLRDSAGSADYLTPEAGAEFGDEIEFLAEPE